MNKPLVHQPIKHQSLLSRSSLGKTLLKNKNEPIHNLYLNELMEQEIDPLEFGDMLHANKIQGVVNSQTNSGIPSSVYGILDPDVINIKKRYGLAGAGIGAGTAGLTADSDESEAGLLKEVRRLYHGTSEPWKAERLLLSPEDEFWYRQGGVDKLPDVPEGYHSIKDYPLGRPNLSKLGTGAGNDPIGPSFFTTPDKETGEAYRDIASRWKQPVLDRDGRSINTGRAAVDTPESRAFRQLVGAGSVDGALQSDNINSETRAKLQEWQDRGVRLGDPPKGALYELEADLEPNSFFNFDNAIREQPKEVQGRFFDAARDIGLTPHSNNEIDILFDKNSPYSTSEFKKSLAKHGIVGGSRYNNEENIFFDPKDLSVLRRFGLAGAGIGAGTAGLTADSDESEAGLLKEVRKLWHGAPKKWKAERQVLNPQGKLEYIEGDVDKLPDLPKGYKLIKDYPLGRPKISLGHPEDGFYTSPLRDLAEDYTTSASSWHRPLTIDGKLIDINLDTQSLTRDAYLELTETGDFAKALKNPFLHPEVSAKLKEWQRLGAKIGEPPKGPLYELNANLEPNSFFNFDTSINQQDPEVKGRFLDAAKDIGEKPPEDTWLNRLFEFSSPYTTKEFKESLIKHGLVGGERWDNDENIFFDTGVLDVVKRHGLAGLGTGTAAAGLTADSDESEAGLLKKVTKLYHGSPHDWDKPEVSKRTLGTGEGARTYGVGLNTAEERAVAEGYRNRLARPTFILGDQSVYLDSISGRAALADKIARQDNLSENQKFLVQDALQEMTTRSNITQNPSEYLMRLMQTHYSASGSDSIEKAVNAILKRDPKIESAGRLYEFGLNTDSDNFLDYDKPLHLQEQFDPLLRKAGHNPDHVLYDTGYDPEGSDFMPRRLEAMERLANAGIPGHKYLDQFSRSPKVGIDEKIAYKVYDEAGGNVEKAIDTIAQRIGESKKRSLNPTYKYADRNLGAESHEEYAHNMEKVISLLEKRQPFDERTRNFIVYNPDVLTLLRKSGLAGLVTGAGAAGLAAGSSDAEAANPMKKLNAFVKNLDEKTPKEKPKDPVTINTLIDDFGVGLNELATSTVGLPGDIGGLLSWADEASGMNKVRGPTALTKAFSVFPDSDQVSSLWQKLAGEYPEEKTTASPYIRGAVGLGLGPMATKGLLKLQKKYR